jgi:lipopolysaccharide/colanic/teichoic acid biosynthesis glycosyltransferase
VPIHSRLAGVSRLSRHLSRRHSLHADHAASVRPEDKFSQTTPRTHSGIPRWFDVLAAAFGLSVLAPFLALVWLLVRLDSPGPGLFRQQRAGRKGSPFTCYKYRTMTAAASERIDRVTDFESYVFNPAGATDQRLTGLGAALRKTSVDELPQLLNVLRGEMSLVGPRPEMLALVRQFPPAYHARHDVLPGLTGEAQVMGRSDLSYAQSIAYDLHYVRRRSARQDIDLIWRTVAVVARGDGAR